MICCICEKDIDHQRNLDGEVFWKTGHNASPVKTGRCCTHCNIRIVIPERLDRMIQNEMDILGEPSEAEIGEVKNG